MDVSQRGNGSQVLIAFGFLGANQQGKLSSALWIGGFLDFAHVCSNKPFEKNIHGSGRLARSCNDCSDLTMFDTTQLDLLELLDFFLDARDMLAIDHD